MHPALSVITVSDRAFRGVYEDRSGPAIVRVLKEAFSGSSILTRIVPDEPDALLSAFNEFLGRDLVLTTGGTGLSPRDITPEITERFCDRAVPGIAEMLRAESMKETRNAVWSRGTAGLKGRTLYINLPGSEKAALFCTGILLPLLPHAFAMARGEGHGL